MDDNAQKDLILKKSLLKDEVKHIDITSFDSRVIINQMQSMSFVAREIGKAAEILNLMVKDNESVNILVIAGSSSAAGCLDVYQKMAECNIIDAVVATGASIIDMDFFEALGFKHYQGSQFSDDNLLRSLDIDRIYDTFIDEDELQKCDHIIYEIANSLEPKVYSSMEFIKELGRWLNKSKEKKKSLIQTCFQKNVPIFCPAFSDCSAGFGLVKHQSENLSSHISIDSVKDFRQLTDIKIKSKNTGLFMIGGGVPKNFIQDTVVCAEMINKKVNMHKYAIQITVADQRDGACSSSTLKEASSWGKVDTQYEQMVFSEATVAVPLIISDVYHRGFWKKRKQKNLLNIFE